MKRLLLVDDEHDITDALAEFLGMHGYEARTAHSVRDAYAVLREESTDLVLSDIVMPDAHGYLLRPLMKNDPRFHHIPLLYMSAYNNVDHAKLDCPVIPKPLNHDHLLKTIQSALASVVQ